jgi:hypothetical protein
MSPFIDVTTLEMSPNLEASTGGQIGKGSDERYGVAAGGYILARVESGELKLVNAAVMMGVSYRQSKRLGQRSGPFSVLRARGHFFYEKVIKSQGRRGGPPFCLSSGETLLVLCRAA